MKRTLKNALIIALVVMNTACEKDNATPDDGTDNPIAVIDEDGNYTDPRDGKIYKTVKIGNQIWMAENLAYLPKVSVYDDYSYTELRYRIQYYQGTSIEEAKEKQGYKRYGVYYYYPAAKEVCPEGWRLPSKDDWKQLANFINTDNGGYTVSSDSWEKVGNHLKCKDSSLWFGLDGERGSDDYGFNGLPGGGSGLEEFSHEGTRAVWWSYNADGENYAYTGRLSDSNSNFTLDSAPRFNGYNIRCILN